MAHQGNQAERSRLRHAQDRNFAPERVVDGCAPPPAKHVATRNSSNAPALDACVRVNVNQSDDDLLSISMSMPEHHALGAGGIVSVVRIEPHETVSPPPSSPVSILAVANQTQARSTALTNLGRKFQMLVQLYTFADWTTKQLTDADRPQGKLAILVTFGLPRSVRIHPDRRHRFRTAKVPTR